MAAIWVKLISGALDEVKALTPTWLWRRVGGNDVTPEASRRRSSIFAISIA